MSVKIHEIYIKRCLDLAKNGLGNTYPNPSVGCVIVHNNLIIGEGYTSKAGGPHAEVNAINSVKDKSLLKEATLYVTLEPCSHFGKTPPCADLICEMNIPRVVIGTLDSNKEVMGRGVKRLTENGCQVTVGILEDECREANKRFFCYHEKKRPYIILKWAESTDGFIAPEATQREEKPQPVWLSSKTSRQLVHKLRSEEQAILVGTTTAMADNPALNTRDWYGEHPLRVVIDKKNRIPSHYHLCDDRVPTLIFTESPPKAEGHHKNTAYFAIEKNAPLEPLVLEILYQRNVQSLIIEGGSFTLQQFINAGLWDEARVFKAPLTLGSGISAPLLDSKREYELNSGNDQLIIYRNTI